MPDSLEPIQDDIYNYPRYYDLVYGSDWKAEFDFLLRCFEKYAGCNVQRIFEPACGTGRLLIKLAQAGYAVAGNDLNAKSVEYCNQRLKRYGFGASAVVGDMSEFSLDAHADVAFNMINSFRHLESEDKARSHLQCVANALTPGGLYVLGLHLTPTKTQPVEAESWSARRGHLAVISSLQTLGRDMQNREELVAMTYDVYTPTRQFRLANELSFRTYTNEQMAALIDSVPSLEIAAIHDFRYNINETIVLDSEAEDVVFVLRQH